MDHDPHPSSANQHSRRRAHMRRALKLTELALQRYGVRDGRLHHLRHEGVQTFRVESPTKGVFALRMYREDPPLRTPDTLRAQLLWLSALERETDVLAPEPLPTIHGSLVCDVYHPPHPRHYCALLRWVPGEHKLAKVATPADLLLLGSYVAKLHSHAEQYHIPKGSAFPRWAARWGWEWAFGESAPLWKEGYAHYSAEEIEVFRTAARLVRKDLERLGEGREDFGVIHRDLTPTNVVFDGERVGAIDFDLCGLGYYAFDLGVIRKAFHLYSARRQALWAAFVEGYERERPLPEGTQSQVETFTVLQRVLSVNRQLTLLGSEGTAGQARSTEQLRKVASWLRSQMRRWEAHAGFTYVTSEVPLKELAYEILTLGAL